jgi:uracil-DNA glycosylase
MGLCFPGKGKTGDLPPRPECAPQWHEKILKQFNQMQLTLLIGTYAQDYYLKNNKDNLTETVKNYSKFLPAYFPLVHPSPLNFRWQAKNPWFESEVIPVLQRKVKKIIGK